MSIKGKLIIFYKCTKKGLSNLESSPEVMILRKQIKSEATVHDWTLVDILYHLRQKKVVRNIVTENALSSYEKYIKNSEYQCFSKVNSDAFLKVNISGTDFNVALEFENSKQSRGRNEKKLRQYYQHGNINGVFFVGRSSASMKQIRSVDKKICGNTKSKVFTCLLEEILNCDKKITFSNFKNDRISLN